MLAGHGGVAIEPAVIAPPPHQPVGHGPEPAGKLRLNPEHMKRILGHGTRPSRKERTEPRDPISPGEMGKRLVGVGHAVHVLAPSDGGTFAVERGD